MLIAPTSHISQHVGCKQEIKFRTFFIYFTTTEGKEANMWLIASLICSTGGADAAPPLFSDDNQSFSDAIGVGYVTLG